MSMVNVQNLGFGGTGIPDALPKAIAELQGMKLTVVTGAAAGTVVPVAGMDPEDHIGSVANMTDLVDVPLNQIVVGARNASAVITCLTTAADGDKVTVNGKVYTFKDVDVHPSYNTPPGVVPISIGPSGNDAEQMADRLSKAIMSGDSSVTASVDWDTSSPPKRTLVTVKVRQPGTAGNAYTISETGAAVTVSGANFTGGLSAANQGFSSTVSLAGKKLLVLWYDKRPGLSTMPLLMDFMANQEELTVTALEPNTARIGEPSFTLSVKGTGFNPASVIVFNGHDEPTTFVSDTEVTTGVNMDTWFGPSAPLPVKVRTPFGDESNSLPFTFEAAEASGLGNLTIKGPALKKPTR